MCMARMSNENRVRELERLIAHHQDLYYNREPELADEEFDALWDELEDLDPRNPLLRRLGEDLADGWPKAEHRIPMGSQSKVSDPESFLAWADKTGLGSCLVQFKLDGASIELQYEEGRLARAVTRGDGAVGDDITPNARKMRGVLEILDISFSGGVRGEVLMSRETHRSRHASKANCRNAANGLMKRKDGVGAEDLDVICYDAAGLVREGETARSPFSTEGEKLAWISARGFRTVETVSCATPEEVVSYRGRIMERRSQLPYDIDGLVVKRDEIDEDDLAKVRPESQIAFKFSPEEAVTTLKSVEWSESGANYTPIGIVEPVRLAGTTVQRANLCNPDMLKALGLKIGSRVVITKRGEIIPKIESLVETPEGSEEIPLPTLCSACGSSLVDEGSRLYCPNERCPKKELHRILKWLSVLDIRDFGETLTRRLYASGRLRQIADLYRLGTQELAEVERMGMVSAQKIMRNLRAVDRVDLAVFLAGFDLDRVGPLVAEKLVAAGFDTLESLFSATRETLMLVPGIAELMADSILKSLESLRPEMEEVLSTGAISLKPPLRSPEGSGTSGPGSFCFTGEIQGISRKDAERLVRESGGSVRSSVTKDLDYLVTDGPGSGSSKNRKAAELGIAIIDSKRFLELMESSRTS